MIEVSRKAVLFDKAIADFNVAETICSYRPDIALYHLLQCTEKMIKGALVCYNDNVEYDHGISNAAEALNRKVKLSGEFKKTCDDLEGYSYSIRYKNMPSDPTKEMVKLIMNRVQSVMSEISQLPEVNQYYNEAHQLNVKLLKNLDVAALDRERKPLEKLLQEVRQNKPKKKEREKGNKNKNRKQEYIK
ncbi:MAG: HEPN domain-containing protein [Eubacteriales bacterium]|nr:HEPN domain-containing protein [Eubacteriales bacterium]